MKVSLQEQISELGRELALRGRVYDSWVESGKLKPEDARRRYDRLEAALQTLRGLRDLVSMNSDR